MYSVQSKVKTLSCCNAIFILLSLLLQQICTIKSGQHIGEYPQCHMIASLHIVVNTTADI